MSIKRKFNKLVNDPQQFFWDSKLVKKLKTDEIVEVGKVIKMPSANSQPKSNTNKASTTFKNIVVNASLRSMTYVEESKEMLLEGGVDAAILCADKAVALDPNNLFAYIAACKARENFEGMPLVLEYAKQVFELYPESIQAQMNYALYAKKHGILAEDILMIYKNQKNIFKRETHLEEYIQYAWEYKKSDVTFSKMLVKYIDENEYTQKMLALIGAYVFEGDLKTDALRIGKKIIDSKGVRHLKKYGKYYQFLNEYYSIAVNSNDHNFLNLMKKVIADEELLVQRLKSAKRVVVVGNSPREIGKSLGGKIDSADLIIRFNNYPDTDDIKIDYGRKCDIWVRSVGSWVEERECSNFQHVVISGTNLLSRGVNFSSFLKFQGGDTGLSVFNEKYHYELIKLLNGPPSAGLMMLYMIYCIRGALVESDIYGFGFTDQLEENVVNIGKSPAGVRHHWQLELELYENMIKGCL